MKLETYLQKTAEINPEREYWFIRTEHGLYYDTFRENNFIAIGWNEITTADIHQCLKTGMDEHIRKKLVSSSKEQVEKAKKAQDPNAEKKFINLDTQQGKAKATGIINKITAFYNLKHGDVVVIPSSGSYNLCFGIVRDYGIYTVAKLEDDCSYFKRRRIQWIIERPFDSLDKNFYSLKKSMHAVTSVKHELSEHIDRVMNNVYFKGGFGHYVIRVKKQEDIPAQQLFALGENLMKLLAFINEKGGFNEPIDQTIVKINVQSNGDFLLREKIGNSIVALAFVVNTIGCTPATAEQPDLGPFNPTTEQEIKMMEEIRAAVDSLQIEVQTR